MESNSKSIFFIMKKKRGRLTEQEKIRLFEKTEQIINYIYNYFSIKSNFILRNLFQNFAVLRQTANYHFHFLILNHECF